MMTKEEYLKLSEKEQKSLFNIALVENDMRLLCAEKSFNRTRTFGQTNVIVKRLNGGTLTTIKPYELVCGLV
ncbi:hypothetical protein IEL92_000259 [Salmonella enterica]|nr:hypothetical protein [Salmonella enterica]EEK5739156.1 hypothetical protein [Salmonella enterica]EEL9952912.1 hypothetical protein [Salmonella enterica]EEM1605850.1 hypothetical protein [Salmonella enterica]EGH5214793.1 hypothetical protein [Salmonella enterica]